MALTGALQGAQLIALDTSAFIYLVEKHPIFYPKVEPIFAALDAGDVRGVTSVLTLLEVLVRPLESLARQQDPGSLTPAPEAAKPQTGPRRRSVKDHRLGPHVVDAARRRFSTACLNAAAVA